MIIHRLLIIALPFLLGGCGCCDQLEFSDIGTAFLENGKLCIGTKNSSDVISFYNVGRFGEGFRSKNDGVLVSSGFYPVSLRYPDTCINVKLMSGDKIHYRIDYILNSEKFRYEFDYLPNGSISPRPLN